MSNDFPYKQGKATVALKLDDYYVWDCSVIKAEGKYWMFSSRWKYEYGFGCSWLFNSQIILSCSDKPEGPFSFVKVILERRGKQYFDGMNTHNTCIKYYNGKYYLYYMGTTYDYEPNRNTKDIPQKEYDDVWYNKRIGLAISDKIDGDYIRYDKPILDARPAPAWDCTAITNPSVIIKDNGETYMIYKSRRNMDYREPMQLGIAHADKPEGPYTRMSDEPIIKIEGTESMEDPFLWFDKKRNKYCALIKDCQWDGSGITGEYGSLFMVESDDCINFKVKKDATVAKREVTWEDGKTSKQTNLERQCILFDENGEPTHLYCATGDGPAPYDFRGRTYVVCLKLEKQL